MVCCSIFCAVPIDKRVDRALQQDHHGFAQPHHDRDALGRVVCPDRVDFVARELAEHLGEQAVLAQQLVHRRALRESQLAQLLGLGENRRVAGDRVG